MEFKELTRYINKKLEHIELQFNRPHDVSIYLGKISKLYLKKLNIVFLNYNIKQGFLGYYDFKVK